MKDIKVIPLYLPQFHRIPENDEWWGEGFTEWVNVKGARPLFEGHYQPRVPLHDNYYDLSDVETLKWQCKIAKEYGIYGFAMYHYWFNGHLLLEKPMEMLLDHPEIDMILVSCLSGWQEMVKAYFDNDLIFATGPAGTGKTYIAIALAVRALKNREIKRIILTRPAVEAGERLGFLPGDLKDKLDPYLQPLYDALGDMIPAKRLQEFMAEGTIQIAPLAYMRGRTLDRACVILDEAQNTNLGQLKMFLTRMGCDAKFIVTGDMSQIDLPNKKDSGLLKGIELTKNIKGVSTIFFKNEDIVRHPLVSKIVKAFEKMEQA